MARRGGFRTRRERVLARFRSGLRGLGGARPTPPTEYELELKTVLVFCLAGLAFCLYVLEQVPLIDHDLLSVWWLLS